jgi:exportin-2 (importin alpha re-exporter)
MLRAMHEAGFNTMMRSLPFACACSLQGQIKQLLTGLMLNTPPLVRAQLSEALTLISGHDFPAAWPQLLPELQTRLAGVG